MINKKMTLFLLFIILLKLSLQEFGHPIAENIMYKKANTTDGASSNSNKKHNLRLIRFKRDGSLDNTFGENGFIITPIEIFNNKFYSIAGQNDGKIVVADYSYNAGNSDSELAKHFAFGSMDKAFGTYGIILTQNGIFLFNHSIMIDDNGKIIVAGSLSSGQNSNIAIARYSVNGNLDKTFGKNGILVIPFDTLRAEAFSLSKQHDGKIIINCQIHLGNIVKSALVRINSNGTLDINFGKNGLVILPKYNGEYFYSTAIQNNEKIIVVCYSDKSFTLLRYNSNGVIDNKFGRNGMIYTPINKLQFFANSLAILWDEKIIAIGMGYNFNENKYYGISVRYNKNGMIDNAFGENGIETTPIVLSKFTGGLDNIISVKPIK